jgi:membrane-associated phospholipid phosphatase
MLVAPPVSRPGLRVAAGLVTSAIGLAIVIDRSHHPSDVLGGFLLAAAVAGLLVALRPQRDPPAPSRRGPARAAAVAALAAVAAAGLAVEAARDLGGPLGPVQASLVVGGGVLAVSAFLLLWAFDRALRDQPRGAAPATPRSSPSSSSS